jgi:hypothetical protein
MNSGGSDERVPVSDAEVIPICSLVSLPVRNTALEQQ